MELGRKKTKQAKRQKNAETPELQFQEDHISPPDHENMHQLEVQDYLLIFMIGEVLLIFLVPKKARNFAQSNAEVEFIARLGSC
jgi:hypothetical protein